MKYIANKLNIGNSACSNLTNCISQYMDLITFLQNEYNICKYENVVDMNNKPTKFDLLIH